MLSCEFAAKPNDIPTASVAVSTTGAVGAAGVAVAAVAAAGTVVAAGGAIILVVDWQACRVLLAMPLCPCGARFGELDHAISGAGVVNSTSVYHCANSVTNWLPLMFALYL